METSLQILNNRLDAIKHIFESYINGFTDLYEMEAYLLDIEYQLNDMDKSNIGKSLSFKFSSDDTTIDTISNIISDIKGTKQNNAFMLEKIKYGLENNSIKVLFS